MNQIQREGKKQFLQNELRELNNERVKLKKRRDSLERQLNQANAIEHNSIMVHVTKGASKMVKQVLHAGR